RRHTRFSRDWSSDVCSSDLFALCRGINPTSLYAVEGKFFSIVCHKILSYFRTYTFEKVTQVSYNGKIMTYCVCSLHKNISDGKQHQKNEYPHPPRDTSKKFKNGFHSKGLIKSKDI